MTGDPIREGILNADMPPASAMVGVPGHDQSMDAARKIRMLQARIAGATYEQIAEAEGYADRTGARNTIIRAMREHASESVQELRELENSRLDRAQAAIWPFIVAPHNPEAPGYVPPEVRMQAVTTFVRLSKRRADMNGLDAPKQVQVSAGVMSELEQAFGQLRLIVTGEAEDVTEVAEDPPEALEA